MRLVWIVIPLVLIGIIGIEKSFADDVLMDFNEWQNDLNRFVTLSDTKISLSNYNSENNNVISELGNSFYWPKFNMTFPEQVKIGESFDVVLDYTYVIPDEDTRNYADPEEICPPVYCERQNIWIVIPTYVDYLNDDRIYESTPSDPRHTPIRTWNLYSLDPPFDNTKLLQETFTFVINKPDIDYPYGFIDISFHGNREAIFYFNAAQDGIVYFDDKVMQSIGDGPSQLKDTPISSIITTREERLAAGPVDGPPEEIWDQFKDYLIEQHSGEDIREMLLGSNIKLSWIDRFLKFYPELDTQSFSSEKDLIVAEDFDELDKILEDAKEKLGIVMSSEDGTITINMLFVDKQKHMLVVGMNSSEDALSIEEYEILLKEIVGDIPMNVGFASIIEEDILLLERILPPLKQIKTGVPFEEIKCNRHLQLIFKPSNNSPACVKPQTAEKLIQRGWAIQQSIDSSNISESDVSYTLKAPVSLERHPIENTDFGTKFGTPVVIDLNFQTQFVTNELENQLFYVANVIPDDVILKYIFKQDFGNDGRTNYSIIYLPPDQDVAADESYGFVYGRGGIIVSVDYLHLTAEQTDIFVDGLLEQRSGSTSKLIDNKRIFYQNGTIGSTQSELVVYDPVLNLVTRVTSYDYDANILEQIALSMVFV